MLKKYGCEKIIEEKFTGTMKDRPGLQTLMNVIRANDFFLKYGTLNIKRLALGKKQVKRKIITLAIPL